jgi:hypothetical protein
MGVTSTTPNGRSAATPMAFGGGSATPKGQTHFKKRKNLNSFWPLRVADPLPKGQGVAEATLVLYCGGRPPQRGGPATPYIFLSFSFLVFIIFIFI